LGARTRSRSERGIKSASVLYSLIESAKLCGVEPGAYLKAAALADGVWIPS